MSFEPQIMGNYDIHKAPKKLTGLLYILSDGILKPIYVTSHHRSPEYNAKIGGNPNSAHLGYSAVDIAVYQTTDRYTIIRLLLLYGVTRIGIYNSHIHFDIDENKPNNVIWLGKSK